MKPTEYTLKQQILFFGRRMYDKNMIAANDGNISARAEGNTLWLTPSGFCKADLTEEDLILIDSAGKIREGKHPVSSEYRMHQAIYVQRPDAGAVVHAHPIYATAFATARISLEECVLPEIITTLGSVPLVPYEAPSTEELAKSVSETLRDCNVCLMANHGVVALGGDVSEAYYRLERVEHYARILFIARLLGGEKKLTSQETQQLYGQNHVLHRPFCKTTDIFSENPDTHCPSCTPTQPPRPLSSAELSDIIREVIKNIQDSDI